MPHINKAVIVQCCIRVVKAHEKIWTVHVSVCVRTFSLPSPFLLQWALVLKVSTEHVNLHFWWPHKNSCSPDFIKSYLNRSERYMYCRATRAQEYLRKPLLLNTVYPSIKKCNLKLYRTRNILTLCSKAADYSGHELTSDGRKDNEHVFCCFSRTMQNSVQIILNSMASYTHCVCLTTLQYRSVSHALQRGEFKIQRNWSVKTLKIILLKNFSGDAVCMLLELLFIWDLLTTRKSNHLDPLSSKLRPFPCSVETSTSAHLTVLISSIVALSTTDQLYMFLVKQALLVL